MSILSDLYKLNKESEDLYLNNTSKYPNLYEYSSIQENTNYLIFPIQMTNSLSFPECEVIYENLTEEIGLFNIYKEINYDLALQKEFSTSMCNFEPPIDQKEFYNDLIYLLQGIPTSSFSNSDKFPFTFKLNENCNTHNIRLIGTLPDMTLDIFQKFINFGTKMQLLQFLIKKYLFDVNYRTRTNDISPFFENFFRGMNELFIKINEKLIFYKKLITEENFTMLTLYNKIKSLSQIINVIYLLFNLKDQKLIAQFKGNSLEEFFSYYNNDSNNNFKKINLFLDMLLKVYFAFYNKDKIFYIIKHILLSSLQSYLYYIINLLFTGNSTDDSKEHFILTSSNNSSNNDNNISLDTKKLPQFLLDYKRALLNNTILTKYIKKFDQNYYNMLSYNLKDFIEYINNINIRDFSIDTLNNFMTFKKEVYQKKIQLMEEVNKQVISLQELKENEINLKNIKKIVEIKSYFKDFEKEEIQRKKVIKEKKEKYYNDLKEQILGKKRRIEEEIKKIKNEEIEQKEKERLEKENEKKFIHLMKLKYMEIKEKTKDIQIFGSLINKWIFQRNELKEKRKKYFEKIYGNNTENNIDEKYPIIDINNSENSEGKKNYHKTYKEQIEFIKNEVIENNSEKQEKINTYNKGVYNNSDNIKEIFNQIKENSTDNKNDKKKKENNKDNNKESKINKDEKNDENKRENKEEEKYNKIIDIDEIQLNISNNENIEEKNENKNDENKKENNEEEKDNKIVDINGIKSDLSKKENKKKKNDNKNGENKKEQEIEKNKIVYDNKNKYLQNINLFPEKEIPEDTEALYKLIILIDSEDEEENNNDFFRNKKNKNKQIPIQLIIKEFFYDVIIKQNAITNQTFVLMLKNKFGLMHHFDFFNSIILCNKGNLILQYIESIFDFKTLTLNTSDPDFLTNELRNIVKSEYENNVKSLYLNSLLESIKFSRLSDLNLNYAINNIELNFKLEYIASPPVDVIFNNSNSDAYDKIFKKLLKFNIYNQICVQIYQMIKNSRNNSTKKINNKKKMKLSEFDDDSINVNEESFYEENNKHDIFNKKLVKLFNKSYKIFKSILSYIYQQLIQKVWIEMKKKIESSMEVFQIIKYHYEALKNITNFFNINILIKYFEDLCNDLAQLYLQIMVSDYYDKHQEKTDFLGEIIEKLKDDNKKIINYRDSIGDLNPYFSLKSYL